MSEPRLPGGVTRPRRAVRAEIAARKRCQGRVLRGGAPAADPVLEEHVGRLGPAVGTLTDRASKGSIADKMGRGLPFQADALDSQGTNQLRAGLRTSLSEHFPDCVDPAYAGGVIQSELQAPRPVRPHEDGSEQRQKPVEVLRGRQVEGAA